jgi:hypothetical protein
MHASGSNYNTGSRAVIPFYLAGSVAFTLAAVLCLLAADSFFGHYFQPRLLAITHIMALGWGTMVIFGALFQFLPVLLEVRLYSEKLAQISFLLLITGVALLAWSFWKFETGWTLQTASIIIIAAILLFGINVYATCKQTKEWNVAADFIITSVGWLLLTVIAGSLLAFNFSHLFLPKSHLGYLGLHAHLGIIGWFLLLIIGVSSRLIPMFLLSPKPNTKTLSWSYYLINLGLINFIANELIFNKWFLNPASILFILGGLGTYIFYIRNCYINRVRKLLDTGMKQSILAFLFLSLPLVLIILISFSKSDEEKILPFYIAYGFSIFFGFLSTLILGQTYKTLPFITWLAKSKESQTSKLMPRDLFSERLAKFQFVFHVLGFLLLLPSILLKLKLFFLIGAVCFILSAIIFNINIFKILSHIIVKSNEPPN